MFETAVIIGLTATKLDIPTQIDGDALRRNYWIACLSELQTPYIVQPKKSIPSSSNSSASHTGSTALVQPSVL